jgi:hypothetical protein
MLFDVKAGVSIVTLRIKVDILLVISGRKFGE